MVAPIYNKTEVTDVGQQSGAHLPIPNRERNEGGELEVVPSHWYPQRPISAVPYSWRREWQPQEQWQGYGETEDDKPSEYSQSRYDRSKSVYEPKKQAARHIPRRKICGLNLSIFLLSCAVALLFVGVAVAAALLGSKVAKLEATMPPETTQQARSDVESNKNDVTGGVVSNDTRVDDFLTTNTISDGEERGHSITGRSVNASVQKTTASTAKSTTVSVSTRTTESTSQEATKATEAGTSVLVSETRSAQASTMPSTAGEVIKAQQTPSRTISAVIATETTMMKKRIAGWSYVGCFEDSGDRILMGDFKQRNDMTNSLCANICTDQRYKYFGTEFHHRMFQPP